MPMRAMILAAGKGNRLRPLTDTVPKPLIEVAGRPMIEFPLELLRRAGIQEVVINLHHLGEQIRARLGDGSAYGLRIHYSPEPTLLDTGGGIAAARPFLAGAPFVLLNADVYIELDLRAMIAFHAAHDALLTLLVRADPQALRRDDVGLDAAARIHRILGHGPSALGGVPLARHMYASAMVCGARFFEYLPDGVYSLTSEVLPRILAAGERVFGFVHHGEWHVLDTPSDLAAGRDAVARIALRQTS